VSTALSITRVGDEYRVMAGQASLRFRSLTPHHDGPTAIVEALDMALGGRPHVDRLALLSSRTRAALAKTLAARWDGHRWSDILDDACHAIYEAVSTGEPAESLRPEAPMPGDSLIEGLIPLDQITVLYADGGSLKSYFALALAVAALRNEPLVSSARWCVRRCQSALYLDWETDRRTHARRLWRLLQGLQIEAPEGLHYLGLKGRPLHTAAQHLAGEVARLGVDLLIVDSLGMACGDEPETAVANLRTLGALSSLPGTKLVLAHVNAVTATSPNGPGRPYGSVFIRNTARSAIEARSEPDGEHAQLVTYYHRKSNDGRELPPSAIRWEFPAGGGVVLYAAQPDLAHAPIPDRILGALDEGEKSVASLSESLGVSEPVVRSALARLEKRGIVDRVDDGLSGRGKKALWIRIDEKRSRLGE
jgi:hypothetical protein